MPSASGATRAVARAFRCCGISTAEPLGSAGGDRPAARHHGGMSSSRLRVFAIVLAALWATLVWELCTSTRITHGQRFWWTPWVFNLGHAPLFGMLAAMIGLALAPSEVQGGWRGLLRAVPAPEARRAAFLAAAVAVIA